jgi:hypothetical protein
VEVEKHPLSLPLGNVEVPSKAEKENSDSELDSPSSTSLVKMKLLSLEALWALNI